MGETIGPYLQRAADFAVEMGPVGWAVCLLAIVTVQLFLVLRALSRKSDQLLLSQFAEVNTRLNMLIFETRRNRPEGEEVEEEEFVSEEAEPNYTVAAE